eukprot:709231-Amphidinium_carterae.2
MKSAGIWTRLFNMLLGISECAEAYSCAHPYICSAKRLPLHQTCLHAQLMAVCKVCASKQIPRTVKCSSAARDKNLFGKVDTEADR